MKKIVALGGLAALGIASVAFAQTYNPSAVSSMAPTKDLIQIIPNGAPSAQSSYACPALLAGGTCGATATGLNGYQLRPIEFKNSDGTTLAASAASGKFGLSLTAGTSEYLVSEAANSSTKTDVALAEFVLPATYNAGTNVTVTVNCNYVLGSGTVGTHTLAAAAYLNTAAGTQGSNLIATTAQTVPSSAGTVMFTITGTSLVPGSRLTLTLTGVIQDTAGSNITSQINSVSLS